MRHALIIGDDARAARTVEGRLRAAGYSRITHAVTADEAWAAACRKPDLVIVLADFSAPADAETLYGISCRAEAPMLVATSHPAHVMEELGEGAVLDGPCALVAV